MNCLSERDQFVQEEIIFDSKKRDDFAFTLKHLLLLIERKLCLSQLFLSLFLCVFVCTLNNCEELVIFCIETGQMIVKILICALISIKFGF